MHPPPTSSKNRLKSLCNAFSAGKRISTEILVGAGLHAWHMQICRKNIYRVCNVEQLEQDIKSSCNQNFL